MSKKDFILLANLIKAHNRAFSDQPFTAQQLDTLTEFCHAMNHNFNRERWLSFINGAVGPSGGKV
jgi:hypothetical protein